MHMRSELTQAAGRPGRCMPFICLFSVFAFSLFSAENEKPKSIWPATNDELIFCWQSADPKSEALAYGDDGDLLYAYALKPKGIVTYDHYFALRLNNGSFIAENIQNRLASVVHKSTGFTLEFSLASNGASNGRLISCASSTENPAFSISARNIVDKSAASSLTLTAMDKTAVLCEVHQGAPAHIVLVYSDGRVRVFKDGDLAGEARIDLDLVHWPESPLTFGKLSTDKDAWQGTIECVALYSRSLSSNECKEEYERYKKIVANRKTVVQYDTEAQLVAKSATPANKELGQYFQALVLYEYSVENDTSGGLPATIRVAHWGVMERKPLQCVNTEIGAKVRLKLERFEDNRQLDPEFLSDTLPFNDKIKLYYDVSTVSSLSAESVDAPFAAASLHRFQQEIREFGEYENWATSNVAFNTAVKAMAKGLADDAHAFNAGGMLFFRASLEFIIAGDLAKQEGNKNPLPAILFFRDQLKAKNIDLLMVFVPSKEVIYADLLCPEGAALSGPRAVPQMRKFMKELSNNRIEVADLYPLFRSARNAPEEKTDPLYLPLDTHFGPRGARIAAEFVARRIKKYEWFPGVNKSRQYILKEVSFSKEGDSVPMLPVAQQQEFKPMQLKATQVIEAGGAPYSNDPGSPIVVLGDSYQIVFQDEDCKAAGFGAHLARALGTPVDVMAQRGSGPLVPVRLLRRGAEEIAKKKLVIWEVVDRDLYNYFQGWKKIPLP